MKRFGVTASNVNLTESNQSDIPPEILQLIGLVDWPKVDEPTQNQIIDSLGLFIPLIVVNCLVLGRAEGFASKQNVVSSVIDGVGMGLGFTFALTLLGGVREMLGSGSIFDWKFIEGDAIIIFILSPGAFIALGYLIALINKLRKTA